MKQKIKIGEVLMIYALFFGAVFVATGLYAEKHWLCALGALGICFSLVYYLCTRNNRDNILNDTPFNGSSNQIRKSERISSSVNGTELNEIDHNGYGVCKKNKV